MVASERGSRYGRAKGRYERAAPVGRKRAASQEASIPQPGKTAVGEPSGETSSTFNCGARGRGMPAAGRIGNQITWNLFFLGGMGFQPVIPRFFGAFGRGKKKCPEESGHSRLKSLCHTSSRPRAEETGGRRGGDTRLIAFVGQQPHFAGTDALGADPRFTFDANPQLRRMRLGIDMRARGEAH